MSDAMAGGRCRRWLVDGSNVVGCRPDGWWRDRPAAFARLSVELERFARAGDHQVTVVYDGPAKGLAPAPVTVMHAAYADDRIVELVAADDDPESLTTVTSDRALAGRVRRAGATVLGSGTFRRMLDGVTPM